MIKLNRKLTKDEIKHILFNIFCFWDFTETEEEMDEFLLDISDKNELEKFFESKITFDYIGNSYFGDFDEVEFLYYVDLYKYALKQGIISDETIS